MSSSGVKMRFDERGLIETFDDAITRVRGPTIALVAHGHPFAMRGVTRDCGADVPFVARQFTAENGEVDFFHVAPGELSRKPDVRFVILGYDEAATGFFIESVNDAGTRHAADAAELAFAMMEQGVDERVFFITRCRMHDDASGFVQHEQRLIFVNDFEGNIFRLGCGGLGFWDLNTHNFACARRVRGFRGFAVDRDMAFLDQPLNRAPRQGRELSSQESIQSLAGMRVFDGESFSASGHQRELV